MKFEFEYDELVTYMIEKSYCGLSIVEIGNFIKSKEIKELKLEVGKCYKTREGRKAFVYYIEETSCLPPDKVSYVIIDENELYWCCLRGKYEGDKESEYDLIDYWTEED